MLNFTTPTTEWAMPVHMKVPRTDATFPIHSADGRSWAKWYWRLRHLHVRYAYEVDGSRHEVSTTIPADVDPLHRIVTPARFVENVRTEHTHRLVHLNFADTALWRDNIGCPFVLLDTSSVAYFSAEPLDTHLLDLTLCDTHLHASDGVTLHTFLYATCHSKCAKILDFHLKPVFWRTRNLAATR